MSNNITIPQIAQAAGVSNATVDRVLNNRPGVNPATVQKVRDAVASLGAATPARGRPRLGPRTTSSPSCCPPTGAASSTWSIA